MPLTESRKLKAFGRYVAQEVGLENGPRPVNSLRGIDEPATVIEIEIEIEKYHAMSLAAEKYCEQVRKATPVADVNLDELATLLVQARDLVGAYHARNVVRRQSAADAIPLTDKDHVIGACDALLDALTSLHNSLNALAWIIGEHIADADKVLPGTFDSADGLFTAMGV